MRFIVMVKGNAQSEAGVLPDEKLLTEMGKYNEELAKAGVMLAGEGLKASSSGTRVRISGNKTTVTDGPFSEAKEVVAGFWVLQLNSKQEAIEWVKRVPGGDGTLEIRSLVEAEDFAPPGQAPEPSAKGTAAPPPTPKRKPGTKRFMVLLLADTNTEAGMLPTPELMSNMGALMEEVVQSGAMLAGDGLRPSSQGARVEFSGKQRRVIDGPFSETKELIAGYCIVQMASKAEAVRFAERMLRIHIDGTGIGNGVVEVREVFETEDFPVDPAEKPDGWRAQELRMREQLGG